MLDHVEGIDPSEWPWEQLEGSMTALFPTDVNKSSFEFPDDLTEDEAVDAFIVDSEKKWTARIEEVGTFTQFNVAYFNH